MTNRPLERLKEALAEAYNDQFLRRRELGASFDPFGAGVMAVLAELKSLDDSTVEAMRMAVSARFPDGKLGEDCRTAFTAAIDSILSQGEEG